MTLADDADADDEASAARRAAASGAHRPTLGLVRRRLQLPLADHDAHDGADHGHGGWLDGRRRRRHALLCDAGGAARERRQWRELVVGAGCGEVGVLVYVVDVADDSDDARYTFEQLASAKWARNAKVLLALTKVDRLPQGGVELAALADAREAEYRRLCRLPLSVHRLDATDGAQAARLLVEVANALEAPSGL